MTAWLDRSRRKDARDDRPEAPHPLVDSAGDGSIRTESRAAVVRLGRAQADLLGRAATEGARPVLVTDGLSVLTEAYRQALTDAGGAWAVRGDDGLRNGLDGGRLEHFTDALRLPPPTSVEDVAVGFLRPQELRTEQLVVSVSVRHRAAAETVLGTTAELLATELAGGAPSGWGTHEPAGRPWDRRALTEAARSRMPDPTRLVVVGSADRTSCRELYPRAHRSAPERRGDRPRRFSPRARRNLLAGRFRRAVRSSVPNERTNDRNAVE